MGGGASWLTVTLTGVAPGALMVISPLRAVAPVFFVTHTDTVPLPVPDVGKMMSTHAGFPVIEHVRLVVIFILSSVSVWSAV